MNLSNNDIMWDCIVDIFNGELLHETYLKVLDFIRSYYQHGGKEVEYNFSHDNWTAICCWFHRCYGDTSAVPLYGHHTLHPLRLVRFLWMKHPLLYPLRLITILDMVARHGIIRRKTSTGEYHTSGLLLDFYVCYSYKAGIQRWILDKLMKTMYNSWDEVFAIYHNHPDQYNYKVYTAFLELDR